MVRKSTALLIHPDAHLVLRPEGVPNDEDPWTLSFANGPCTSDEAEHQPVTIAVSDGGGDLELEFFRWMADQLASALGVELIMPEEGKYIAPNGVKFSMTSAMKERYPSTAEYLTHTDLTRAWVDSQHGDEPEAPQKIYREMVKELNPTLHDDSPYNIHHKHDEHSRDEEE